MRVGRTVRWDLEVPLDSSVELVTRISKDSYRYVGIALDALDGVEEGQHRIALTLVEARELHAALGAVLAAENFPTKP